MPLRLKILNGQAACSHQEAAQMSATGAEDIKNVIAQTFGTIEILARALHVQDARLQPRSTPSLLTPPPIPPPRTRA
jgi:hypothetical protein